MKIEEDFKDFIRLLNANRAKYLIVGGVAVSFYAEPRFTKDIDIFVEVSEKNSKALLKTLMQFGFAGIDPEKGDILKPDQIIQVGYPPLRINIITAISGIRFSLAWDNRVPGLYGDVSCFYLSREDLILNKLASGRDQDKEDLKQLEGS